jgi:hypothetical protein
LGVIAAREHVGATAALLALANGEAGGLRDEVAVAFSGVALRRPAHVLAWLDRAPDDVRAHAIDLLREGFESLEEDFAEEQFFAVARAVYWSAASSATRTLTATLIDKLEF